MTPAVRRRPKTSTLRGRRADTPTATLGRTTDGSAQPLPHCWFAASWSSSRCSCWSSPGCSTRTPPLRRSTDGGWPIALANPATDDQTSTRPARRDGHGEGRGQPFLLYSDLSVIVDILTRQVVTSPSVVRCDAPEGSDRHLRGRPSADLMYRGPIIDVTAEAPIPEAAREVRQDRPGRDRSPARGPPGPRGHGEAVPDLHDRR